MLLCSLGHLDIRYEPDRFLLGVEVCHARFPSLIPSRVGELRQHSLGLGTFVTYVDCTWWHSGNKISRLVLFIRRTARKSASNLHTKVLTIVSLIRNHRIAVIQYLFVLLAGYPTWSLERWGYCPSWWVCSCLRYVWTHTTPGSSPTMVSHSTFFTNLNSTDSSFVYSL